MVIISKMIIIPSSHHPHHPWNSNNVQPEHHLLNEWWEGKHTKSYKNIIHWCSWNNKTSSCLIFPLKYFWVKVEMMIVRQTAKDIRFYSVYFSIFLVTGWWFLLDVVYFTWSGFTFYHSASPVSVSRAIREIYNWLNVFFTSLPPLVTQGLQEKHTRRHKRWWWSSWWWCTS